MHEAATPVDTDMENDNSSGRGVYVGGAVVVLLAAAGVAVLGWTKHHNETTEAQARTAAVERGPLVRVVQVQNAPAVRSVSLPGEVRAFNQTSLYAKVAGYLKTITVDKGDRVKKGQLLATLESPDLDQQIAAAEADLSQKDQAVRRAEALAKPEVISQQELEQAQANAKVSRASLDRARAQRDYANIRVPFDGVITARYVDPGALLPAATGSTASATPIVDVADLDRLRIYVYLGQGEAPFVHAGDPVKITVDGQARPPIEAKVTRVAQALDPRTRTMLAEVDLENVEAVYPGSFVHVSVEVKASPMPLVPSDSLVSQNGGLYVARVDNDRAHFVPVTTGFDDGKNVQILSGLAAGQWVARNLSSSVVDGARIQAIKPEDKASGGAGPQSPPATAGAPK